MAKPVGLAEDANHPAVEKKTVAFAEYSSAKCAFNHLGYLLI